MTVLIALALLLVAAAGLAVVRERDPLRMAIAVSVQGIVLALLFLLLKAPEVALAQVVVGTAVMPLMTLFAFVKIHGGTR